MAKNTTRFCSLPGFRSSNQRRQQGIQGHGCDGGGFVAHGVGQYELTAVNQGSATVHDVGDVAVALVLGGRQERVAHRSDDAARIVPIQQQGAEGVLAAGLRVGGEASRERGERADDVDRRAGLRAGGEQAR